MLSAYHAGFAAGYDKDYVEETLRYAKSYGRVSECVEALREARSRETWNEALISGCMHAKPHAVEEATSHQDRVRRIETYLATRSVDDQSSEFAQWERDGCPGYGPGRVSDESRAEAMAYAHEHFRQTGERIPW